MKSNKKRPNSWGGRRVKGLRPPSKRAHSDKQLQMPLRPRELIPAAEQPASHSGSRPDVPFPNLHEIASALERFSSELDTMNSDTPINHVYDKKGPEQFGKNQRPVNRPAHHPARPRVFEERQHDVIKSSWEETGEGQFSQGKQASLPTVHPFEGNEATHIHPAHPRHNQIRSRTYSNGPDREGVKLRQGKRQRKRPRDAMSEDEDRRRRRIGVYFGKRPFWSALLVLGGAGLIVNPTRFDDSFRFYLTTDWAFFIGLFFVLFGIFWHYFSIIRPDDEAMDEWTVEELQDLESRAFELIDLDSHSGLAAPIVLAGFPQVELMGSAFRSSRYGQDHVLRYTPRALTVLCFTPKQVVAYEGAIDLVTGNRIYENVREFFYKDISSIGLVKETLRKDMRLMFLWRDIFGPGPWSFVERLTRLFSGRTGDGTINRNSRELFKIGLLDGSSVKVILRDGRFAGDRRYDEIPISADDKVIRAIREFVKERKNEQVMPTLKDLVPYEH